MAVLLMAYGAPESLEDIPAFLRAVRGGRPVPDELARDVAERYRRMGRSSPLVDITKAQAGALQARLDGEKGDFDVYVGMRHSEPTIASTVERMSARGHETVVALPMTPYRSPMSFDAYMGSLSRAVAERAASLEILPVRGWSDHPLLIEAFAERIGEASARIPAAMRAGTVLLLTGHSLPKRSMTADDPYSRQIEATAGAVARKAGYGDWRFAYQSASRVTDRALPRGSVTEPSGDRGLTRGNAASEGVGAAEGMPPPEVVGERPASEALGAADDPWLGPDAGEVIGELADKGVRSVLLAPIGFLADNMETLYDDDILYRGLAERRGVSFARAEALNASATLSRALAEVVREALR
ncbi:MAG: ferrochelatase [Elusimicrobiota bacterium]